MAIQKNAGLRSDQHRRSAYKFRLACCALLGGMCLLIIALTGACTDKKSDEEIAKGQGENAAKVSAQKKSNFQKLAGRWVRTDGGYIIEIRNVAFDGKMDAGYFNPRPINVSVAKASLGNSGIQVFIELQDQGYPGSTYTLVHDPAKDVLKGFYYQAAMQQTFDVIFARVK